MQNYDHITLENIQKKVVIDVGHKSKVWLAQYQEEYFALKQVDKKSLNETEIRFLFEEKKALTDMSHPRMIKLIKTFQDSEHVYLLLTLAQGCPLNHLLKQQRRLGKSQVQWIVYQLSDLLSYIHNSGFVFRDLKLSNIIYDDTGNIKLVDFGHCTQNTGRLTDIAGTRHCMSPEMITHLLRSVQPLGYSYETDWWALGILTYELLVGIPPFGLVGEDIFENIMLGLDYVDFSELDQDSEDFIRRLLSQNPERRLGHNGIEEVLGHRFLESRSQEIYQPNDIQVEIIRNWCEFLYDDEPVDTDVFLDMNIGGIGQ